MAKTGNLGPSAQDLRVALIADLIDRPIETLTAHEAECSLGAVVELMDIWRTIDQTERHRLLDFARSLALP